MEVIWRDWYCQECSLQFDSKSVFDLHLSLVHGEKLEIKEQNLDQETLDESEQWQEIETFQSETVRISDETKNHYNMDIKKTNDA